MFKLNKFYISIISIALLQTLVSCNDHEIDTLEIKNSTAAVTPYQFEWENRDWMPTPAGQSKIPVPWVGQGSITSTYGLDVVNDRKSIDGWELVYNTFNPNASGHLRNPYFILYNKYRGIMRIFLYITTEFVTPSTYIQDNLSIVSSYDTPLLNFMGTDLIDGLTRNKSFSQNQATQLAANKWYMMQYEFAYDPSIANIPYNLINLNWDVKYHNISTMKLGGEINGTIVSSAGSSNSNLFSALGSVGKVVGEGVLGGIGQNFLKKHTIDAKKGTNTLGLPEKIFKSTLKGSSSAVSNTTSKIPGVVTNLFSAILGGSSGGTTMSFDLHADITIEGSMNNSGQLPSNPTSMYVPGTNIPSTAIGYIPLHNNILGVFNFLNKPTLKVRGSRVYRFMTDFEAHGNETYKFPEFDFKNLLVFNPSVLKIADIKVKKQDLLVILNDKTNRSITSPSSHNESIGKYDKVYVNPDIIHVYYDSDLDIDNSDVFTLAVRFQIEVKPKNGAPSSAITKTFLLKPDYSKMSKYIADRREF